MTQRLCLILVALLVYVAVTASGRVISSANIETLKLAHVLFRHGSRSPLSSYHKDPYNNSMYWPDGLGQLTAKGKQQEYELGKFLSWRYEKFIEKAYKSTDVYAKSSDIDRAIMSGQLVLAGMFPPNSDSPSSMWNPKVFWQPIPIHTLPPAEDNKIVFSAKCPRYEQLLYDYFASPEMETVNKQFEYMYKYLSAYAQANISNVLAAAELYDVLYIQELHNLTLPQWAHLYYPEKLKLASEGLWSSVVATKEMARLRGGALIGEFMLNIERFLYEDKNKNYPNPKAKLYLYSGHDSTIATMLGALRVFETQIPPYGSAAIFELHQERATSENPGEYFVKVFYRNETQNPPYELKIPGCNDPCTLDAFKRLTQDFVIMDWGTWNKECQIQTNIFTAMLDTIYSDFYIVAVLMFLVGFLFAMLIFGITLAVTTRKAVAPKDKDISSNYESTCSTTASTFSGLSNYSVSNNNYKFS